MNTFYSDERVSQSIWADNTEVLVLRRSYPSGSALAITFAYGRAEWSGGTSMTVELNPEDARSLAANLLHAAEDQAEDAPEPIGPLGRDEPYPAPF